MAYPDDIAATYMESCIYERRLDPGQNYLFLESVPKVTSDWQPM